MARDSHKTGLGQYTLHFDDFGWYCANRNALRDDLRSLPTFTAELPGDEFRFKADEVRSSWSYDLRVFLRSRHVDVEVSSRTRSLYEDLRTFVQRVRRETPARLVDDDGIPVLLNGC